MILDVTSVDPAPLAEHLLPSTKLKLQDLTCFGLQQGSTHVMWSECHFGQVLVVHSGQVRVLAVGWASLKNIAATDASLTSESERKAAP